ncbi:MAG: DUF5711 family protein [Eubacterium sp.]|nr:DUF5711 family protein [Eubacterium sp.]
MAGNQREMHKKELKAKKDKRNKTIVWIVIAVIVAILIVMKVCEININTVKEHFTDSNGKFSLSQDINKNNFPYNLDSSQNVVVKNVNNKLGILTPSSFTVLDTKKAVAKYTFDHGYSNPIIKTSGIYSLIVDQGSTKLRLDNTSENVYENELSGNILCGDVAKNGNTVVATLSGDKLCNVSVYNKSLDKKMSYDLDYGYIVDIAINNSASKIAFVAVNSKNAQLKAKLYTINIGTDKPKAEIDLPNCNVLDLKYNSDNLYVVADNFVGIVSNQKKLKTVFECGKINTVCYNFTPNDELVLAYNDYNNSTENKLVRVRAGGNTKSETKVSGNIRYISASSSTVSVLTNSNIITYSLGNMKEKKKISVDDSVKSICQMGSTVFVHRQSLIDKSESGK